MMDQEIAAGRKTALYDEHVLLGAKMVEFAGWQMPMLYEGIVAEHRRVRSTAGLFDVSHMGEFIVSGPDALPALERLTTNRVAGLDEGRVQYTAMCYEDGGFVDDLIVYAMSGGNYMLVVNAANLAKDLEWIRSNLEGDASVEDVSDATALVALQGPSAQVVLECVSPASVAEVPYYTWTEGPVAGRPATVSRTGYTGEDGFEIYCEPSDAPAIWGALLSSGCDADVGPVGLGARDTLRLEMGYSLYGNEMGPDRTPPEAGLMWITKLDKGDFIGRDAIARKREEGVQERIVGFELTGRGVPRSGHRISVSGEDVGFGRRVLLDRFDERSDIDDGLSIEVRNRQVEAQIVRLPFYRDGSVRRRK